MYIRKVADLAKTVYPEVKGAALNGLGKRVDALALDRESTRFYEELFEELHRFEREVGLTETRSARFVLAFVKTLLPTAENIQRLYEFVFNDVTVKRLRKDRELDELFFRVFTLDDTLPLPFRQRVFAKAISLLEEKITV